MNEVLTLSEVAAALGIHRRTAMRWVQGGRLEGFKTPGGHWRVQAAALERAELSAAEFAALVGVHKLTVRRWCEAGKVQCRKSAGDRGHWRLPASEVLRVGARPGRDRRPLEAEQWTAAPARGKVNRQRK